MKIINILMPASYWLLAVIWLAILVFCLQRIVVPKGKSRLFATLMVVLALEAFRTFFESVYFGTLRTAQVGILPAGVYEYLILPENTIWPKIFNLLAGITILFILTRRFIPQEIAFWEDQQQRIRQLEASVQEVRRAESTLRESEERYSVMIRQTGQMLYDHDIETGRIRWHGAVTEITGYSEEEIAALDISGMEAHIHPEHRQNTMAALSKAMNDGLPFTLEYQFRKKDGSYRWVEDNGVFLNAGNGPPVRVLGTVKDIEDLSRRRENEELLRKYEQIVSASNDFLALVNKDYRYEAANNSYFEFFRLPPGKIVGQQVSSVLGQALFDKKIRPHMHRAFTGETVRFMSTFDSPVYGPKTLDVCYSPYFGEDNTVKGIVVGARDVTEARKLEKQLQQAQKMEAIGQLAGGIAHDFNNILGAIVGYAELSRYAPSAPPKVREYTDRILQACERAKNLVGQILTFSRRSSSEKAPIDIGIVVREALELIRASTPTSITIQHQVPLQAAIVMANENQIHQVVMNLCTNAVHALEADGGVIDVELEPFVIGPADGTTVSPQKGEKGLKLTVSDSGQGIDPEIKERIFDPYFTTKTVGKGTGLGLSTVMGIVNDHGGTIAVESVPGEGTRFTIWLPMIDSTARKTEAAPPALPDGNESILLVDDEKSLVEIGRHYLERLGYDVETHMNPQDALEAFRTRPERYDLVISDMNMPGMTGKHLAMEIRKIRPGIPIIMCTGFSHHLSEHDLERLSINALLMKPVGIEKLAGAVRRALT
ncbi:hypothetical protein DSCA_55150 [Desulfosarcina alkanivorans]|uniref:histidine kinase n=1 Tax=Desulfosarcina alkanivorans TaxID=571177 RepID=A0A5K7YT62_9BACT|nr:ATP-binding protein [Desulfosarcina alkanivorans]BBO71585.1 hypothetical protein DSCA_55150 [Desulfosarcina alkanivorans]